MRIAVVSDYGSIGGAALAANRLMESLRAQGCEVRRFAARYADPREGEDGFWGVEPGRIARQALRYGRESALANILGNRLETRRARRLTEALREFGPDVISMHNVHGVVSDADVVQRVADIAPVVWTLHDAWAFTGGCRHTFGCTEYADDCRGCEDSHWDMSRSDRQAAHLRRRAKRAIARDPRVTLVSPSAWLATIGSTNGTEARVIPNGIDTSVFRPIDGSAARAALGLGPDERVVLFVADWVSDVRKGLPALAEAIRALGGTLDGVVLLVVGSGEPGLPPTIAHLALGPLKSDRLLRLCYCAADICVVPSQVENLPTTAIESLACGTPCVGFDVGGIGEVIRPYVTGRLAPAGDVRALAEAMRGLLESSSDESDRLGEECRRVAVSEYDIGACVDRYLDLFRELAKA
jgi:glycosyltransferase involved in cell wall biosynthesis